MMRNNLQMQRFAGFILLTQSFLSVDCFIQSPHQHSVLRHTNNLIGPSVISLIGQEPTREASRQLHSPSALFATRKEDEMDEVTTTSPKSTSEENKVKANLNKKQEQQREKDVKDDEDEDLQETLSGGANLIFAMARRMLVWDDEDYQAYNLNDASSSNPATSSVPRKQKVLPRWHPTEGIADANPNFRTSSPIMNNKGYRALIKRNSRKNNKAGLWRHSLRMYDKMRSIELEQEGEGYNSYASGSKKLLIRRDNAHFEAALVACAKLGLWREAIKIYNEMQEIQNQQQRDEEQSATTSTPSRASRKAIEVNEYVILSVIKACARGMRYRVKDREYQGFTMQQKRHPLDSARNILQSIEEKYGIRPKSMHVNALSCAYQHLGLYDEANDLFKLLDSSSSKGKLVAQDEIKNSAANFLKESAQRRQGLGKDMSTTTAASLNRNKQLDASKALQDDSTHCQHKDEASYTILVKNAVTQGDWSSAIYNLREMTETGYYPKSRSLNSWSETANKRERRRKKTNWIKQREQMMVKSTFYHSSTSSTAAAMTTASGARGEAMTNSARTRSTSPVVDENREEE